MRVNKVWGGLWGAVAMLASGVGCQSQVGEDYRGEAILTLEGSVELGAGATGDQVPVLAFPTADFSSFVLVDARVEGEFPARFRMSVFDPPPANARADARGVVRGFLTVVPTNHPSEVPNVTGISNGTVNADGSWTFIRDICTADQVCLQRTLSCTMQECPIVGQTGNPIPPEEATLRGEIGVAGGDHLLELAEYCADGQCYRVFRKCDLAETHTPDLTFSAPGHITTCTTVSETGDARVNGYEALLKSALGYHVVYSNQALAAADEGPLAAGYNVFKTVEPETDQAWIDSMLCSRDMPESTVCPPGVRVELVDPGEQLHFRIGYRP